VVEETLQFVENELMDQTGAFYSSLDADSNNAESHLEEGAYYKKLSETIFRFLKNTIILTVTVYGKTVNTI